MFTREYHIHRSGIGGSERRTDKGQKHVPRFELAEEIKLTAHKERSKISYLAKPTGIGGTASESAIPGRRAECATGNDTCLAPLLRNGGPSGKRTPAGLRAEESHHDRTMKASPRDPLAGYCPPASIPSDGRRSTGLRREVRD